MARDMWKIDRPAPCRDGRDGHDAACSDGRDWDEFGRSLRELYDGIVAQPLPDSFASLLHRLDAAERQCASGR